MARKPADQSVHPDDIILAAADVLQRNGYDTATMKDIAAAVNLTAASLYHHFRNKDELLLAVLERGLECAIELLEPIAHSGKSPEHKLRDMIQTHIVSLTQNTAVSAAMVFEIRTLMHINLPPQSDSDSSSYADFVARRDTFFAQRAAFEALYRRVIQEGIDAGSFCPVDVGIFTKTMLGAYNWVGVWYRDGGRLTGEQIAQHMADIFLRALQA